MEWGISLKAHAQNSLILLRHGWPVRLYVRDLEGASVSRPRAAARGWMGTLIPEPSPALYAEREAWQRFQYYVVVNHLGHLFSVLARISGADETALWAAAAEALGQDARFSVLPEGRAWVRGCSRRPPCPRRPT